MSKLFEGKTAVVTGSARGIGRSIALALASEGARIVVHYGASKAKADDTVREIEALGGDAFALSADLRSVEQIATFFDGMDRELKSRAGNSNFDFLINNAGAGEGVPTVVGASEQQFDDAFNLNVKGVFFMCQYAAPRLNDNGRVVNLSSVAARGNGGAAVTYKAAKRAVNAITESFAGEMGGRGITVNAVAPGATVTDMIADRMSNEEFVTAVSSITALKRLGQPEDIANFIVMLCRPESGWVTGQIIEVSGGLRL